MKKEATPKVPLFFLPKRTDMYAFMPFYVHVKMDMGINILFRDHIAEVGNMVTIFLLQ